MTQSNKILDTFWKVQRSLSDEVYELKCNAYSYLSNKFNKNNVGNLYKKGSLVRLISGVNNSIRPGYNPNKGWVTVCSIKAKEAHYVAFRTEDIKKIVIKRIDKSEKTNKLRSENKKTQNMNNTIKSFWIFRSDSNPNKEYQTLLYTNNSTSCDCPGWTRRSVRSCKHTRWVECGLANSKCIKKGGGGGGSGIIIGNVSDVEPKTVSSRKFDFSV
jgi:hypothetical protein